MLNISPIGRNCSQTERDEYEKYDIVSALSVSMLLLVSMPCSDAVTICDRYRSIVHNNVSDSNFDDMFMLLYRGSLLSGQWHPHNFCGSDEGAFRRDELDLFYWRSDIF